MRAAVAPVHQPGLGCGLGLANQRVHGHCADALRQRVRAPQRDAPFDLRPQRVQSVGTAARADKRGAAADQTAARRQAQRLAGELFAVRAEHVDVQQPPDAARILYARRLALDLGGGVRAQQAGLQPRV